MSVADKPTEAAERPSWTRWALRSAYQSGLPRGRHDVLEAAGLLVLMLVIRVLVPLHDWLLRAVVAYLLAASGALLIGYLAHYAGPHLRRRRKVTA